MCGNFGSLVWGIGSSELPSLRVGKMGPLILFSSVMVTLELGRLASGTKEDFLINLCTLLTSRISSSLVIDTLCPKARERKFRVFYLYCNYREELSAADLIAGLLKKVVAGLDGTPEKVSQEFEGSEVPGSDRMRPLLPDVEDTLGTVLASFERAFICIDALDELPQKQIPQLLDSLAKLILLSSKIRLFLTGRPPIRREIGRWFGKGAQILSIRAKEEDIKKYITRRLDQDPNPDVMDSELKSEIVEILPQKASGM